MHRFTFKLLLGLQIVYYLSALTANAQDLSPSQTLPGSMLQDLQQKTIPTQLRPDTQRQTPPESEVEESDKQTPAAPQGEETPQVKKVMIKSIQVQDVTLLDSETVKALVAPYENRPNSFDELQELTEKITALYREQGYITSRVYIPPQKLQDNMLVLQALEGKFGKAEVQDGSYFKARSITGRLALKPGDPFNANVLKANLRHLNENPDRNVRAVLKAGEHRGETDIEMQIRDRRPIHLSPSFDNLGRRLIGDNRIGLRITHNNLTGYGDNLLSSLSFTRRSFGVVNHYELPLGSRGTKIGLDHAYSKLRLGEEFSALDIQGTSSTYSAFISQSLINEDRKKLSADMAFDVKQLDTNFGDAPLNHDQLRVLRTGVNFEEYDNWGRTFMRHELGFGLDVFGATSGFTGNPSRTGAGSKFFRYNGSVIRTQRLPFSTFGIFRAIGQWSPDRLVSAEQFQAGGAFSVRGYREGQIIGDSGYLLTAEWRVPVFFIPSSWKFPFSQHSIRQNVQLVPFMDMAGIYINRPAVGIDSSETVLGAGMGLRVQLTRNLSARLDVGYPLLKQDDISRARLHFGLQNDLF